MTDIKRLSEILDELKKSNLSVINDESTVFINAVAFNILHVNHHDLKDLTKLGMIVQISNIIYNNTDRELCPIEDGIYDMLIELYKAHNPKYQVGAEPIHFEATNNNNHLTKKTKVLTFIDTSKKDDMLFYDDIINEVQLNRKDWMIKPLTFIKPPISKRIVNTGHSYPKLVGTLDKAKFVLNCQAIEKGVYNDSNVSILERDFFAKHIQSGILDPNRQLTMVIELKYDGISVEADVSDEVYSARSRGDANEDVAADLTPILQGKKFRQAKGVIPHEDIFGMKFEAIMTYQNLWRYNQLRQKDYKNCRTAISGLFASSDAPNYADFITLVPLATSIEGINRLDEIEFMNKYYRSEVQLRYAVLTGTYIEILFQVKAFVEEAEFLRGSMPFMYDGVVLSYTEPDLIERLGRENAVNKYSIAIKFNPLKKQTTFRGYDFTIGKDGSVTPMIYYDPVEFYGTIHDHSTGHSLDRFKTLNLKIGDVLDVEYTNDVMPYVTKPENYHNLNNPNPSVPFPVTCTKCGSSIEVSKSGKSASCNNIECPGRNLSRMVGMIDKLNVRDFAEESIAQISRFSLTELFELTLEDVLFLGEETSKTFIERMNELKTCPIYDYTIVGSLGFTNIGREKWKLILNHYTLYEVMNMGDQLKYNLVAIKGIGPGAADTIVKELDFFRKDLNTVLSMKNVMQSKGVKSGKSIRFTGIRDSKLEEQLNNMGHDANGKAGITKATDILIIPYATYTSPKTVKAVENGHCIIVAMSDFVTNMDKYL